MAMNRGGNTETLKESRGDNDDQMMIQALEKSLQRAQTCWIFLSAHKYMYALQVSSIEKLYYFHYFHVLEYV